MGINKTCRAFKSLIQREGLEDEFEELDDMIIFLTNKMGIASRKITEVTDKAEFRSGQWHWMS